MAETQNTGQFAKTIVTDVGKDMIAKSQNGQTLTFSRVALGDGLVGEEDVTKFTAVKNERLSLPIAKYSNLGNGQFQIQFRLTNSQVESGFWHREIGIMAKIDNGQEQLYAYTTAGNKASFIYDKTTPVEERIVNVNFVIGNAQNLEVIINSSVIYATIEDLEEALDAHDAGDDAHEAAFAAHNADGNAHKDMVGATSGVAGKRGMVPAPAAGDQNKALFGDATYKQVVQKVNGVVADSAGDVNLNFKFYNSFSQLGLTAATVTPKAIVDALPSNSMLVTFITTLTSSSSYTPNMELPANTAGLLIVIANTQGSTLPVKFELICQTGGVEKYIGRYITNGGVGFYGWRKPIVNDEMLLNGKLLSSLYDFASQAEAEAGNNTNKPMNALRVAQAISALAPAAVIIDSLTNRNGYFVFSNKIAVQWTIFSFPASVKSYTVPLPLTPKQVLVAIPVDVAGQDITVSYSLAWNFNKQTEVEFFVTQAQSENNAYSCIVISKIE